MYSFKELREKVWEINMELPKKNLVIYTFGNVIGIYIDHGVIAIKPTGFPYYELTPDMMVLIDMDNNVIDSSFNPSSDTKTHLVLYKNFPNIGGVVHTHSPYATAWAQAQKSIPCLGTTHADHIYGDIPCTGLISDKQIKSDYEEETGNQIIEQFKDLSYEDIPMVLLADHGPFTWGETPKKAVYNSVILEELAKMAIFTLTIDPTAKSIKKTLIDKHFLRKHGKNSYYGQK